MFNKSKQFNHIHNRDYFDITINIHNHKAHLKSHDSKNIFFCNFKQQINI